VVHPVLILESHCVIAAVITVICSELAEGFLFAEWVRSNPLSNQRFRLRILPPGQTARTENLNRYSLSLKGNSGPVFKSGSQPVPS
jgi:hypothetical protein